MTAPERHTCSRAGCRLDATATITWRNPRIHTGDRHKVWLACEGHIEVLRAFLAARAFPLEIAPVDTALLPPASAPIGGSAEPIR